MIQNEIFGPVMTVQRFDDEAKAIEWATGTRYAPAASVWTRDIGRAMRVAHAGHVDVLGRGLHRDQARDGQSRVLAPGRLSCDRLG
jgi:acyl-CoA reductase-like NAD-dependent aldehyde dehydrogenase